MLGKGGQHLVEGYPAGGAYAVGVQHDQRLALADVVVMHGHIADHDGLAGGFFGVSGGGHLFPLLRLKCMRCPVSVSVVLPRLE